LQVGCDYDNQAGIPVTESDFPVWFLIRIMLLGRTSPKNMGLAGDEGRSIVGIVLVKIVA
jgi:hypothetical protein